jgi:hypothetical protein
MRSISLWAVTLLLMLMAIWPVGTKIHVVPTSHLSKIAFQNLNKHDVVSKPKQNQRPTSIDTSQLKETGWYAGAMQNIEESEYEIKWNANTGTFSAPNRSHNLRASYAAQSIALQPRKDSTAENWNLELTTQGIYAGENLLYEASLQPAIIQKGATIQFNHDNNFITEYINNSEGIRQNFIIEKQPAIYTTSLSVKLQVNDGWVINQVHSREIHFAKAENDGLNKKLTYNQLKVWDADKKELDASFSIVDKTISIDVNTVDAVYPITIDPLSTTADVVLECNQANALMGRYLSSAGDVNGDGYSDVIVGVALYDNGETDEGAAFLYHGSATGISATPAIILEANQAGAGFGGGVSGAGDINADGYSDIIVGALYYDNGQTDEGAAFIYSGSATGISATPAAILESNQVNGQMGSTAHCAGDQNVDG